MTPEEQRIAIAEACGWKDCHVSENWAATIGTLHEVNGCQYAILPDYLNDLGAMHEAEKVLEARKVGCLTYCTHLIRICGCDCLLGGFEIVHATASQRAEAFLRTLNLWTDGP